MIDITIRRAEFQDLDSSIKPLNWLAMVYTSIDNSRPLNERYATAFEAIDRDPNQLLAVVEHSLTIVGCLQLTFVPSLSRLGMWRGQIESVRIASNQRGSGLGQRMFEWAISECRARKCGLVQLTSDKARPDAIRFYEGLGFTASHEGFKLEL